MPTTPADTQGRRGKHPDGRARTREVKLGCLFTQSGLDPDGRPMRDEHSSSYVATLKPAERFGTLVYAEARRRGVDRAKRLIALGDGAPWICNLAELHFPTAIQIVDLYHAREHLHALGALAAPTLGPDHPGWLADRLAELDRGDVTAVLAAARALTLPDTTSHQVDKALGYFQTNQQRIRYAHFRELACSSDPARSRRLPRGRGTTPQTVRHALERARRHRHRQPALPPSQRPLGKHLDPTPQPHQRRLT